MVKTRECSQSCMDYLLIELVNFYESQDDGPGLHEALESIGLRVGAAAAERCVRGRPAPATQLELIKLVCKDLWSDAFGKGVDNLRTNHRGTYVLRDVSFRWLARLHQNALLGREGGAAAALAPADDGDAARATSPAAASGAQLAADRLVLPCALLRGALRALGLDVAITADATHLPQVDFTIVVASAGGAAAASGARGTGSLGA